KIMGIALKTAKICWGTTMVMAFPLVFFPEVTLYPLLGGSDMSLISDAQPILYVLIGILSAFAIGGIYFNALAGTGATFYGLKIQFWCALFYILIIYTVVEILKSGLAIAWSIEMFYWIVMIILTIRYLRSGRWQTLKV
ncbi:MAG: hypothetical protein AAFO94_20410, partial [Bacteroidota bacterium]